MANCNDITFENLSDLNPCENNASGVKTLFFCPRAHIDSINAASPAANASQTATDYVTIGSASISGLAISCKEGKGFYRVHCTEDLGELKYASQGDIPGTRSWLASLDIYHAGFHRAAIGFMSWLVNAEVIVVAQMNNGEWHLLGDIDRGCRLRSGSEMGSGKAATDNNGINPIFEYNTGKPKIFWEGFDPRDETHGIPIIDDTEVDGDGE